MSIRKICKTLLKVIKEHDIDILERGHCRILVASNLFSCNLLYEICLNQNNMTISCIFIEESHVPCSIGCESEES